MAAERQARESARSAALEETETAPAPNVRRAPRALRRQARMAQRTGVARGGGSLEQLLDEFSRSGDAYLHERTYRVGSGYLVERTTPYGTRYFYRR